MPFVHAEDCENLSEQYVRLNQKKPKSYAEYQAFLQPLSELAQCGFIHAYYDLSIMLEEGRGIPKDDEKALEYLVHTAENGDKAAQHRLARAFATGKLSLPIDYKEAYDWVLKAANQGLPLAQSDLGFMYQQGQYVQQDQKQALYWYEKAAEQGYPLAQFNVGSYYLSGLASKKDRKKAIYWYEQAAEAGLPQAIEALRSLR